MKQLTALTMVCLLVLASCQKPEDLKPGNDINYTQADFVDTEAIGTEKEGSRKSNLKMIIREVDNAENTYRLVLKVDSVMAPNADGVEQLVPLGNNATIEAALSIPNPFDPKAPQVVFNQSSLTFRKQNENGYYVFVSDMFKTDINFDYELVQLNYLIGRWTFDDEAGQDQSNSKIAGEGQYYVLPSGKTVEQAPKIAKVKPSSSGRDCAGSSAIFESLRVTTYDDPMGEITKVLFKGEVMGKNSNKEDKAVPLETILETTDVNGKIGVSNWTNTSCINFFDEANKKWRCLDQITTQYTNLGSASGTFYLLYANGDTCLKVKADDLICGETDHF